MKQKIVFISFSFFLVLNIFVWGFVYGGENKKLTVAFLDVGQGDAIYIEAPNGKQMLIDGGADRKVLSELGNIMPFSDKTLDVVIATHPDADHIGGLPFIFDEYEVSNFVDNGSVGDTQTYKTLQEKILSENLSHLPGSRGMKIILDEESGVVFEILSPYSDPNKARDTNSFSVVGQLSYGSSTFMLTGDATVEVEKYLVEKDGSKIRSNVLKAGHHGSKTSSSEIFLKTVAPEFVVISAGLKNRYGHPHKEVIDLLQKFGIKILSTAEDGTVVCESDSINLRCD